MSHRPKIVLATGNRGKLAELRELLADLGVDAMAVRDLLGHSIEVIEDGATFEENAAKKARAVLAATGLPSLADDSGLEVDALRGAPGVHSARYSGVGATDESNNRMLLEALRGVSLRSARFRCVLALMLPGSALPRYATGSCEGMIGLDSRGNQGFGYDPLFVVEGCHGRTMAELEPFEKNTLSHRARAMDALRGELVQLLQDGRLAAAVAGKTGG